jgi:hypothetical protein
MWRVDSSLQSIYKCLSIPQTAETHLAGIQMHHPKCPWLLLFYPNNHDLPPDAE